MNKKLHLCVLGLGISFSCFAGTMGVEKTNRFYVQGMVDYNWFNYRDAYTASFFGPQNIGALAASIENRWGYGVGLGYLFNDYIRTGITLQNRPHVGFSVTDDAPETAVGTFNNYTAMLNAYLSYPSLSTMNFKPYIMGGIGVAHNKTSDIFWPAAVQTEFSDKITQFAWQAGLGALWVLNDSWALDVNYTFVSLGEVRNSGQYNTIAANNVPAFGAPTKFATVYSNQVEAGVHYRF